MLEFGKTMSFVKRKSAKNWMGVTASLPWLVVCHHKPAVGHIWMKGSMRSCSSTVRHGTRSMKLQTLDLTSAWPVKEGSMAKESTSRIKAAKVDRVYSIPGQSVVTVVASSLPVRSLGTLFVPQGPLKQLKVEPRVDENDPSLPVVVTPSSPFPGLLMVGSNRYTKNLSFLMALKPIQKWLCIYFSC